jgi:hypothetical protein
MFAEHHQPVIRCSAREACREVGRRCVLLLLAVGILACEQTGGVPFAVQSAGGESGSGGGGSGRGGAGGSAGRSGAGGTGSGGATKGGGGSSGSGGSGRTGGAGGSGGAGGRVDTGGNQTAGGALSSGGASGRGGASGSGGRTGIAAGTGGSSGGTSGGTLDKFGIRMIYPTVSNGQEWYSKWDNGTSRSFTATDPSDPWFDANHGPGSYRTAGDGVLKITGGAPRMYVHSPSNDGSWTNIEITTYGMRVDDSSNTYAGIMAYARTNHGTVGNESTNFCDDRGYGGMVTYDGRIQFEKEILHHSVNNHGYSQVAEVQHWSGGMPKNVWIGYKFVLRDKDNGAHVALELWLDESNGASSGGQWSKIIDFVDDGTNFGVMCGGASCDQCAQGIDTKLVLTSSDSRPGSETHQPNVTVYFRSDGVNTDGLRYKTASIRQIAPLP